jgi:23S rRNA pseudouridine2605 synthase
MPAERLQKIIAAAGVASRRNAEELITSGRVVVNGQVITQLGTKADPEQDHIRVDGKLLQGPERHIYVALNKPKGYVTTVSDEKKRPTVMDLVGKVKGRVYPVGRLDWASEGLILMTNDGALANALMKASSNVSKVYVVKVAGQPDETKLDKLRRGVSIAEKGGRRVRTAPAKIRLIREGDNPWLEVTIIEGRNRQVRKMFEEVGHHVEKIRRVQYGPLALDVPPGDWRNLTLLEVAKLKAAASGAKVASPPSPQIPLHAPKAAIKPALRLRPQPANLPRSSGPSHSGKPSFAARSPRASSSGKPSFTPRSPNPARSGKPSFAARSPRPSQGERPSFADRPSKPSISGKPAFGETRSPRASFSGKPSFAPRSPNPRQSGKPSFTPRSSRPLQSERPSFAGRPSKPSGPGKPAFGETRSTRGTYSGKPSFSPRTPKPAQSGKRSFAARSSANNSSATRSPRPYQSSKPSRPTKRKRD